MIRCFFVSLVLSVSVFAGIRTVGNGGGFGEMKSLLALQEMGQHIELCLALPSLCVINGPGSLLLKQVLRDLPRERTLQGGIQFFNDPSLRKSVETQASVGAPILINSSLLTSASGVARSLQDIGPLVLWGLLRHQRTEDASGSLKALAQAVFRGVRENLITTPIGIDGQVLKVHRLQIYGQQSTALVNETLLIEDPAKTYDLIESSNIASLCTNGSLSVRIQSAISGTQSGDYSIKAFWSCDKRSWGQAVLFFQFRLSSQRLIQAPIRSSIRGLIKPASGV